MSKDADILRSSVEGTLFYLFTYSQKVKRKVTFLFPCSHWRTATLNKLKRFLHSPVAVISKLSLYFHKSHLLFISKRSHWYHVCCIALVERHMCVVFLFCFLPVSIDLGRLLSACVICNNTEMSFGNRAPLQLCIYHTKSKNQPVINNLPGLTCPPGLTLHMLYLNQSTLSITIFKS